MLQNLTFCITHYWQLYWCITQLASRLLLTIMNILTTLPNLMDSPIYIKLNSLYEAVVKTTSTGLRPSTRLTSLLLWQQEPDPRNKQKLELALDEMRNVCVGGASSYASHITCALLEWSAMEGATWTWQSSLWRSQQETVYPVINNDIT